MPGLLKNAFSRILMYELDHRISHSRHNHLFVMFGDDFEYKVASQNFRNMDAMIEYMNTHHSDKYFFKYSTPSEYIDAVKEMDISWPTKYDDMFPYADSKDAYWTGFFTSRPNHKSYVRTQSSEYHASAQLYVEKLMDQGSSKK